MFSKIDTPVLLKLCILNRAHNKLNKLLVNLIPLFYLKQYQLILVRIYFRKVEIIKSKQFLTHIAKNKLK